jgi:hypothetical protein
MRRVYLRGHANIRKRLLIHTAGFNLGLLMRRVIGVGTPRSLQGRLAAALSALITLIRDLPARDASLALRPTLFHARACLTHAIRSCPDPREHHGFHHGLLAIVWSSHAASGGKLSF